MKTDKQKQLKTMSKEEFEQWYIDNYEENVKLYMSKKKRNITNNIVREVLADFYYNIISKKKYKKITNIKAYLNAYMYNRLVKFYQDFKSDFGGYVLNTKNTKVVCEAVYKGKDETWNAIDDYNSPITLIKEDISKFLNEDGEIDRLEVLHSILPQLTLDEKNLYDMLYVENIKIKEINEVIGFKYDTTKKIIDRLKLKIEKLMLNKIKEIEEWKQ